MLHEPRRWKLNFKNCSCVNNNATLVAEQTTERCGWVMWSDVEKLVSVANCHEENWKRLTRSNPNSITDVDVKTDPAFAIACFRLHRERVLERIMELEKTVTRLTAVGNEMAKMVGDHHWTLVWNREIKESR